MAKPQCNGEELVLRRKRRRGRSSPALRKKEPRRQKRDVVLREKESPCFISVRYRGKRVLAARCGREEKRLCRRERRLKGGVKGVVTRRQLGLREKKKSRIWEPYGGDRRQREGTPSS